MSEYDPKTTLTREFTNSVSKPHETGRELQEHIHHQSMESNIEEEDSTTTQSGFIKHNIVRTADEAPHSKKKLQREFINQVLHEAVRDYLYVLEQQIEMLKVLRDEKLAQIEENNEKLLQIGNRLEGIQDVIDHVRQYGVIELDIDGTLMNKHAEAAVHEYEKRIGKIIDRENTDEVYAALVQQREHERNERDRIEEENERLQKKLDDINEDLKAFQDHLGHAEAKINRGEFTTHDIDNAILSLSTAHQLALLENSETSDELKRIITKHLCKVDQIDQDTVNQVNMTLEQEKSGHEPENSALPSSTPFTPTTSL